MIYHRPVLLKESLQYLITNPNGNYFDATAGFGGHSEHILERLSGSASLILSDKDKTAFEYCQNKFEQDHRVRIYNSSFTQIGLIKRIENIDFFDGIFADLGVSSFQLDNKDEGFTFRQDAPLDLRMDKSNPLSASVLLNTFSQEEIADIIFKYGEERASRKIAQLIVESRALKSIESTQDLVDIVKKAVPERFLVKTLSRVFQAFRIYINDEINELELFLKELPGILRPGGRIVVLSYHSLEDRTVKQNFKYESLDCVCSPELPICTCGKVRRLNIITKKPLLPQPEEIQENPRARSAKLRAAERV